MTALAELDCRYVAVPRFRGQQLKQPAQLDGWLREGRRICGLPLRLWRISPVSGRQGGFDELPPGRCSACQLTAGGVLWSRDPRDRNPRYNEPFVPVT